MWAAARARSPDACTSRLGARVTVLDPRPQMLRYVPADGPVRAVLGAAEAMPFPDDEFDCVVVTDAFHHFRDQPAAVREFARVVKPGGGVLVVELDPSGVVMTATPVWCNRKGDFIFINVMKGFRKEKNMRANPNVSLLVYDPQNPLHNIEIRGRVVEMTEDGAVAHNDELARLYLDRSDAKFFGDAVPAELQSRYTPVRVKIAPTHIRVES